MITASIVTYNTSIEDLNRLINCVLSSSIDKLFIIDHSEKDYIHKYLPDSNRINYFHNANRGYGAGHNVGLRKALELGSKYHVVLNHDVYWKDKVIAELAKYMDAHPECGLIMPNILYPDGSIQYLCKLVPTPGDLILRRFIPIKSWQTSHNRNYELQWTGYDKIMEVPILSGCFMMLRCDTIRQTKGFDERYFLYAEDVDLCRRIGEVSTTIFYPGVSVFHEYAKGSYKNKKMRNMHIQSIIKYFNKWGWIFDKRRVRRNRNCINKLKK
ncbi:MAG: glycosyltransferase family 2 protein [Muribaculaceae bacterium]|nr:glycosyltransferase family 2 protein [Muribaculaceae bacterium]MDE6753115.1 glycosyltransferase family 2 protein [Muribaculaceae bacterium]